MTTGKINKVAFLGDTTTRTIPDANETRGRDRRGSHSYRARAAQTGRSKGRRPLRRHRILHLKEWVITHGPIRWEFTRLEHASLLGSLCALCEAWGGKGQLHIRIPPMWVHNTWTPPRRKAPRALGWKWWGQRADSSMHQHGACRH